MKKDIERPKVENVSMAIVQQVDPEGDLAWYVMVINEKNEAIKNVLVSSCGYGILNGKNVKTSELRHFVGDMEANSFQKVERIMENVFLLTNQYWLSFYAGDKIYDKKYIFVPDSIQEDNFTDIPLMGMRGVLIR